MICASVRVGVEPVTTVSLRISSTRCSSVRVIHTMLPGETLMPMEKPWVICTNIPNMAVPPRPGWVTDRQIEASRVAMTRFVKRGGKIWVRLFPDKPISKKPAETRMGKGKGAPEFWVAVVKPGRIMFELEGLSVADAREAMTLAAHKLPIHTKFVIREEN